MEQDLNNFENLFTWPMDTHSPSQSADANTTHICMARCEEAFVCESLQSAVHQAFSIKYKEIAQFFCDFFMWCQMLKISCLRAFSATKLLFTGLLNELCKIVAFGSYKTQGLSLGWKETLRK